MTLPFFLAQTSGAAPVGTTDYLMNLLSTIDSTCYANAQDLYVETLMPVCISVAMGILPVCFCVEMSFCGFRIMSGDNIVRQFSRFFLVSIICYLLIFIQLPQRAMIASIEDLRDGGKLLGSQIITKQLKALHLPLPTDGHLIGPVEAWGDWVGQPPKWNETNGDRDRAYKFGYLFIRSRVMRDSIGQNPGEVNQQLQQEYKTFKNNQQGFAGLFESPRTNTPPPPPESVGSSMLDAICLVFAPLQALALSQPMSGAILAGATSPALICASILGASYYAFYIGLALGTVTVPFCFFQSFDKAWQNYLRFCFGVSLVPMFYYIFGAIGFLFSTQIFEIMFPANGSGFGDILGALYVDAITTAVSCIFNGPIEALNPSGLAQTGASLGIPGSSIVGAVPTLAEGALVWVIYEMVHIYLMVGRMVGGCIIVTAFITAGNAFPIAASRLALAWERGFTDAALLHEVGKAFDTLSTGVVQGVATSYATGMSLASSMASNMQGFGGVAGPAILKGLGRGLHRGK